MGIGRPTEQCRRSALLVSLLRELHMGADRSQNPFLGKDFHADSLEHM